MGNLQFGIHPIEL